MNVTNVLMHIFRIRINKKWLRKGYNEFHNSLFFILLSSGRSCVTKTIFAIKNNVRRELLFAEE